MSRSIRERLADARAFSEHGENCALGLDAELFGEITENKFAVYYCLIGIGEALKEIPRAVLDTEPTIPWNAIIGMRNRLVHAYWRIDDEIVHRVARLELPALAIALERIIKRLDQSQP